MEPQRVPNFEGEKNQKLNQMIHYCETDQCLRQFILNYFGEDAPCTCEKCSNCVVIEEETEQNYIKTGSAKKRLELADLTPEGQELFEQLRGCRSELAASQNVPPFIICSDKTLKRYVCEMSAKPYGDESSVRHGSTESRKLWRKFYKNHCSIFERIWKYAND